MSSADLSMRMLPLCMGECDELLACQIEIAPEPCGSTIAGVIGQLELGRRPSIVDKAVTYELEEVGARRKGTIFYRDSGHLDRSWTD